MNILICSTESRVKMVQYLKETMKPYGGKAIAGDSDPHSPALYVADDSVTLKPSSDDDYIPSVLEACKKKKIDAIIPLIEEEVPMLIKNKPSFDDLGVKLVTSEEDVVTISTDKLKTYEYIKQLGYPGVPTVSTFEKISELIDEGIVYYPLIVKPTDGKASQGILRVENEQELKEAMEKVGHAIIQPYVNHREYGIDVYVDLINGELVDFFIKEKNEMTGGATNKSISVRNEELESLIQDFIEASDFIGPLDIDCFEWKGKYYISEINPRFGAGYLHAHEMGNNFMEYILLNISGQENKPFERLQYEEGISMMKYSEVMLKKLDPNL